MAIDPSVWAQGGIAGGFMAGAYLLSELVKPLLKQQKGEDYGTSESSTATAATKRALVVVASDLSDARADIADLAERHAQLRNSLRRHIEQFNSLEKWATDEKGYQRP